jgi:hypothetical protein
VCISTAAVSCDWMPAISPRSPSIFSACSTIRVLSCDPSIRAIFWCWVHTCGSQKRWNRRAQWVGAEIEMWLHDHAVNDARSRRGELPITGLWLWGGGPAVDTSAVALAESAPARRNALTGHSGAVATAPLSDIAFGRDAYLQGLWAAHGEKVFPLPQQLAEVFSYPQARRAVLAIEIGSMLHSNPTWTFFDALAQIDRCFIAPAIDASSRGQCERVVILANDHQLILRARDRLKFWRRIPPGLSGLQ